MQELLKKLNKINIKIDLVDEKLDIQAPKGVMTADLLNEIKLHKDELIEFIRQHKSKKEKHTFILKVEEQSSYILSSSQKRLWLLSQFEEGNVAYNMPDVFELKGNLNISLLEKAFKSLIQRHESLRTIFNEEESGQIRQFILSSEESKFKLQFDDVSQKKDRDTIIKDIIKAETNYSFDLSSDSLLRAKLIKISENSFVFVCVMHHIISDGQSSEIMTNELFTLYDSFSQGNENPLSKLSIQYKDYAAWQQNLLKNEDIIDHKLYWLKKFEGEIPVLDLPTFQTRPLVKTFNGKQINTTFDEKLLREFNNFCQSHGTTLFMGLLAVTKTLLFRYTYQTDIVIGSPIAGREHTDLQNQIGFYVNTLALRTQFDSKNTFTELLAIVKEVTLGAYNHQTYPFDELISQLSIKRDLSRNPLFDVMVTYQNVENLKAEVQVVDNIEIRKFKSDENILSKFDMDFVFSETINGIELGLTYNTDIYKEEFIVAFLNHFDKLLQEITLSPENTLASFNFLSTKEKKRIIYDFNATKVDYPKDKAIVELFEEQVEKTPDNIAVVFENNKLTYKELNDRANQIGAFLRENYYVKPDDLIGIVLDRSTNFVVSILGVLKSGAAYVPIDPNYPQNRIDFIIADSDCKYTIDDNFFNLFNATEYSKEDLDRVNSTNDLAYVIYTSGTTGQPKGVMVEQRSLVNLCHWHASSFEVDANSRGTLFSGIGFDASVWEIFPYLLNGSSLYPIKSDEIRLNINEFSNFIKNNKISHCYLPSAICNEVANSEIHFDNVKFLTGGEALKIDTPSNIEIYNNYGPTENTIVSTFYKLKPNEIGTISIGRPISNTQVLILDEMNQLTPIGVSGKIFVSGTGLTRGYLNKPELTAEKFLDNPFEDGIKMYDTGDLGKWLPDGNIEFLGRKDFQVKIRGYRIELGEIETNISQFSQAIKQVVADVQEVNGEKVLVVYYTTDSKTEINKTALREYLQGKLPSYMVPGFFVELGSIPLTPNGKKDRKALPNIANEDLIRSEYVAPRNENEQKLVEIWQEVLGVEKVGVTDNFFELGGHSLMVAQVLNRIHQSLAQQISFKEFFANQTIEGIIKNLTQREFKAIPKATKQESYPLTPSQQRLWVLSQLEGGSQAYNMPAMVNLKGKLNHNYFEKAFQIFINRHDITRTSFKSDNQSGEIRQYITPKENVNFKVELLDFTKKNENDVEAYLHSINREAFNLEQSPLLKAFLLKRADNEFLFFLTMHHIIGDGWSIEVLISEVVENYNRLLQGYSIEEIEEKSASLPIQYKDYAVWLQEEINGEKYQKAETYWLDQFKGELPVLDLPSFKKRPLIQTYSGNNVGHLFSKDFTDKLKRYSEQNGVTLFMTLMAGIKALLYRYTGQQDIIVGTPIAGREHPDLENQIGLYLNTLAIRTRLEENNNTFKSLLEKEKDTLLSAYEHQMYPFDELVGNLNLKRDTSRSALFDVLVVFQNQSQLRLGNTTEEINGLEVTGYEYHTKTSKFDISFAFAEEDNQLVLAIDYNTDIYDEFLISRMFLHIEKILTQAIEEKNSVLNIEDIDFLSQEERHQLLVEFNDKKVDFPKDKTIIDLFEEQVAKTPNDVAVVFEDIELTYKELNEKANKLGDYLRQNYNIQPDDLIAIKLERSEKMIIAILGVLKSGAAYVPIDPNYPQDRIDYIEEDSNSKILIDDEFLNDFEQLKKTYSQDNLERINTSNSLAYVIYTSGTTGQPKGVMIENKSLVNYIISQTKFLGFEEERLVLLTTYTFDASVEQIFLSLLNSSSLYVISDFMLRDNVLLREYLNKCAITHIHSVPTLLRSLNLDGITSLRRIISAGENYEKKLSEKYFDTYKLYNKYGPTEATISTLIKEIISVSDTSIGSPISNTQVYLLDEEFNLVPIGVTGKMYLSGAGLARGYLNKPDLTVEKFLDNPFKEDTKMYDTGDLARWLPDGNIEFLGRKDFQVKIRGYRIELGEIESNISMFSTAIWSVLVDVKEVLGENVLVAYYAVRDKEIIDKNELRKYLQGVLPDYMIPNFFIILNTIPLLSNGKINRKDLPNIKEEDFIRKEYVAPRNATEKKLAEIWQEILGTDKIGVTDNFFDLGGHSLKVAQVLNKVSKSLKQQISFKDFFASPTIEQQVFLLEEYGNTRSEIKRYSNINHYKASTTQTSIWLNEQIEILTPYNLVHTTKIEGNFNIPKLEKAFNELIRNEEVFRTSFLKKDNYIEAQIIQKTDFNLQLHSNLEELDAIIRDERNISFNIGQTPLIRVNLVYSDQLYFLVITFHHIILDGISIRLFYEKLIKYYLGIKQSYENISFKDYMIWVGEENQQINIAKQKEFLINKFSDIDVRIDLPNIRKTEFLQKGSKRYLYNFSNNQHGYIKRIKSQHKTTSFSVLLAALHSILYRYSKQNTIVTVVPLANRISHDLEDKLGFFMNTILIKSQFQKNTSFNDLVNQVKKEFIEGVSNGLCLLEDWASSSKTKILNNLNVMASFEGLSDIKQHIIEDIKISQYFIDDKEGVNPLYDLVFRFFEADDELSLEIEYDISLFDEFYIKGLIEHLDMLLKECLQNGNLPIDLVNIIPKEEKELILSFNNTEFNFPKEKNFINLFEKTVINSAQNIAIEYNDNILSYEELNNFSNSFARYLKSKIFIQSEDRICVKINKSHHLIYVLIGILKTGACYVPIDPTYPKERKEHLEKLSNAIFYIDDNVLEEFLSQKNIYSKENIEAIIPPTSLFHIMFTSGSTGAPKGVMLTHRNIVNFVTTNNYFPLNKETVLLSTVASSFDTTNMEFWGVLVNGGKLIIADKDDLFDYNLFEKIVINKSVNSLWLTASWFSQIAEQRIGIFKHLKQFISGGDILSLKHVNMVRENFPNLMIINGYGPTENTTFSTTYKVKGNEFITLPIGKPLANTKVHIMNENLLYDPIGVIGTIYLSGENIAKGYFNNEKLTCERFIDVPNLQNGILYNTGDIGRWLPDGNIEFFGRNDFQVKIRGYRVELDEIENKILQFSDEIKQTVIIYELGKSLVAYLTTKSTINTHNLKEYLLEELPRYMVPDLFIILEEIPLTPNGKIDRKFLSSIEKSKLINLKKLRPETVSEKGIYEIWKRVIGLQNINIDDNFFDIGGNSLLLMELITKLNEKFKKTIRINELYKYATIKEQARLVDNDKQQLRQISNEEILGITLNQKRWLVTNLIDVSSLSNKNIVNTFDLYEDIDVEKITNFFTKLVEKHDILRTRFYFKDNLYKSEILPISEIEIKLEFHEEDSETIINELKVHFYNLNQPPLFKVAISKSKLYLSLHHLVSDAWSFKVLIEEWQEFLKHGNISTGNIISYKDVLKNDEQYLKTEGYRQDRDFWIDEFNFFEETKFPEKTNNLNEEGKIIFYFQNEDFNKLNEISEITGKSINIVLTTIYFNTLALFLNNDDIAIGIPVSGRDDFNRMCIGFFVKMLMVRIDTSGNWLNTLKNVENKINLCNYHSNYPYDLLIEDLNLPIYENRFPLSSVFFNLVDINLSLERIVSNEFLFQKVNNGFSRYDLNSYIYIYNNCIEIQSQINISKIDENLAKMIFNKMKININKMYNYLKN